MPNLNDQLLINYIYSKSISNANLNDQIPAKTFTQNNNNNNFNTQK